MQLLGIAFILYLLKLSAGNGFSTNPAIGRFTLGLRGEQDGIIVKLRGVN